MPAASANPFREFKKARKLTYEALAEILGCSPNTARKLGAANGATVVSARQAKRFERRTRGELAYADVMAWVGERLDSATRSRRRAARRRAARR